MPASAADPHPRLRAEVLGTTMSYADTGTGTPVVFLHGNPTSSYLWRNVIPHVAPTHRCLAPDLVGMGDSGPSSTGGYRFTDHYAHLAAWFDTVVPDGPVHLVIHDWGSALGFHWANEHRERVLGIAYMEALVRPVTWAEWPEQIHRLFRGFRSPAGEEMVLEKNVFVERVLPGSVLRELAPEEMERYRAPYRDAGETRRPTLTWPREIPIDGEPADVDAIVARYAQWLETADLPKLFIDADPGAILTGPVRDYCLGWPNQTTVRVRGSHFVQEDSPDEIGAAIAGFVG